MKMKLTARQWATIDAIMDNAAQSAIDLGADNERQMAIRQAGWDQVPWVGENKQWPPDDQVITIDLTTDQWLIALSELEASDPVYEEIGDVESRDLGRSAGQAIRRQLR
jgi:hypothetical protein